jgi:pimeloyl-ACP methyl ester carboxylesterase/DNA-binding CsgD family transcriptional regulator
MRQEVLFCEVPGGRVACATVGKGPPLVLAPWWISHVELDWERPDFRGFVEALARSRTVVRYDPLGTGLSDRADGAGRGGLDSELATLGAVLDGMDVPRAALLGISSGACVAAALAARSPERVEALVLVGGYPSGAAIAAPEVRDSILAAVRAHWGLGSRLLADVFLPESTAEELEAFARFQREAASAEAAAEHLGFVYEVDVRNDLPRIHAPTLVLHRRDDRAIAYDFGRELAAAVPGARLFTLSGSQHLPWRGDAAAVVAAVGEFLDGRPASLPERTLGDGARAVLTERELEVLRLVARGLSDREIAERLVVSPHTVHRHVANVRAKLGEPSRAAAVASAARHGLI